MKGFKRVVISAGLGAVLSCSSLLCISTLANADEGAATSEGGASSVSTQENPGQLISPTSSPSVSQSTGTGDTTDAPGQEADTEGTQPTDSQDSSSKSTESTDSSGSASSPDTGTSVVDSPSPTTQISTGTGIKPGNPGSPENPLTGVAPKPMDTDTVEIYWAMPYPGNPDNVTWPQNYASADYLQCGIWYQVDTYLKSEAQNYTLDGVLNLGEDYQNDHQRGAISWRFVYGGDCAPEVPPKPDDKTETLDSHDTKDCDAKTITHVETTQTTTYTYSEQFMVWVANVALPVTTTDTREATEEECPVSTPTTPSPSSPTTLTTTPTPVSGSSVTASTTATHTSGVSTVSSQPTEQTLAKTGANYGAWPWVIAFGLLLIGVIIFLVVIFREKTDE